MLKQDDWQFLSVAIMWKLKRVISHQCSITLIITGMFRSLYGDIFDSKIPKNPGPKSSLFLEGNGGSLMYLYHGFRDCALEKCIW